jgi:hypothetical protein
VVLLPPLLKLGEQVFLVANPIVKGNHLLGLRCVRRGQIAEQAQAAERSVVAKGRAIPAGRLTSRLRLEADIDLDPADGRRL